MNFYKRSYQPILHFLYSGAIKCWGEVLLHRHFKMSEIVLIRKMLIKGYTAKNIQVVTSQLTSRNNLLQQANVRMRWHDLRQLVDHKFVTICHQTCCNLTKLTSLLQIVYKLMAT